MRTVLAVALLSSAVAASEVPPPWLGQLGLERWTQDSGLPSNWVRAITRTADGFLWVATSRGLVRFDGRTFRRYSVAEAPDLPTDSITALSPGAEGRLWVGLEHGGVARLESGELRLAPGLGAAFATARVNDLVEDAAGALWIATSRGLWRARPGSLEEIRPAGLDSGAEVMRVVLTAGGDLWARSTEQGLWRVRDGVATTAVDAPGCRGYGLAADDSGPTATTCRAAGVFRWDAGRERWERISAERGTGPLLVDRAGAIWFSGRAGLHRWSAGALEVLPPETGLGDWRLRTLFEDRQGDLWFGTFNGGLARLHAGPIRAFAEAEGLPVSGTAAVLAGADDDLWIGSYREGLLRWKPGAGVLGRWRAADGLPGDTAWALARDPRRPRGLWVGSDRGLAWMESGRLRPVGPGGLRYGEAVQVLYVDPAAPDTLWLAGGRDGAWELSPGRAVRHDAANGLEAGRLLFFHRTRDGRLVAGGDDGMFDRVDSRWVRWPSPAGPLVGARAVAEEADGTLWLTALPAGLVRRGPGGELSTFGPRQGIPFGDAYSLALTPRGDLWISSEQGLFRMRLDDHARWRRGETASVPFERLDRRDGLRDGECNGWGRPAVTRLASGALVYPTQTGVALVDPLAPPGDNLTPDRIYVDAAWAGARLLPGGARLALERHERSLRVAFSAIEWQRPEAVRFRHRLEGIDAGWVPAHPSNEAVYAHVPAGTYRFRLEARLPGRNWIETAEPLVVVVAAQPWESPALRAVAALALLALGLAAFRWRIGVERRHASMLARERSRLLVRGQEEERRRIGRELHDDLTQRLAGLSMLAWSSARASDRPGRVAEVAHELEKLANHVQALSRELHPSTLEALDVVEALRFECATFARRTGLAVTFEASELPLEPPGEVALALHRIAQEGLRNALKHSGASGVYVSLAGDRREVQLEIRDEGAGFESAGRGPGLGLRSMRERARLVGGSLDVQAAPGSGVRIAVRVPLDPAAP